MRNTDSIARIQVQQYTPAPAVGPAHARAPPQPPRSVVRARAGKKTTTILAPVADHRAQRCRLVLNGGELLVAVGVGRGLGRRLDRRHLHLPGAPLHLRATPTRRMSVHILAAVSVERNGDMRERTMFMVFPTSEAEVGALRSEL